MSAASIDDTGGLASQRQAEAILDFARSSRG
jgi:hypothetical protein